MRQIFKDMFELRVTMLALSDLVKRAGMKHLNETKDLLALINLQAPLITSFSAPSTSEGSQTAFIHWHFDRDSQRSAASGVVDIRRQASFRMRKEGRRQSFWREKDIRS